MHLPSASAFVWVSAGSVLAMLLAGCGSNEEAGGRPPSPSANAQVLHVLADSGCNMQVAPIRLPAYQAPPFISGPAPERIHTKASSAGLRGYPRFPSMLDGLPNQGVEPRESVEGIFYFPKRPDGLTYDELLSQGGVLVSASRVGRHLQHTLAHPRASLTRVRIGASIGWLYQRQDSVGGVVRLSVNWVTTDGFLMSITAQRRPSRLVRLARSLAC